MDKGFGRGREGIAGGNRTLKIRFGIDVSVTPSLYESSRIRNPRCPKMDAVIPNPFVIVKSISGLFKRKYS